MRVVRLVMVIGVIAATSAVTSGAVTAEQVADDSATSPSALERDVEKLIELPPEDLTVDEIRVVYSAQVAAVAKAYGISEVAAASGLRMQEPAGRAWSMVSSIAGAEFGGSWIDWRAEGEPTVVVAFVSGADRLADVSLARELLADSGLPLAYREVEFAVPELEAAARSVVDSLAARDVDLSTVAVWVDETANLVRVSGVDAGIEAIDVADGRISVVSESVDAPIDDAANIRGGWDGGICTMAFALVAPNGSGAIPTTGHCSDFGMTSATYPSPLVLLGSFANYEDNATYQIDRQTHSIPGSHVGSTTLFEPASVAFPASNAQVTRGNPTRVAVNASVFYYGQSSVASCGRQKLQLVHVTGFNLTDGRIIAESPSPMAGGGTVWIKGDSGGPVWALNTAIAMISDTNAGDGCASTGTGHAIPVDRQFTDSPADSAMTYFVREGAEGGGTNANFAAIGTWHARTPSRILDTRGGSPVSNGGYVDVTIPSAPADLAGVTLNIAVSPVSGSGIANAYPVSSGQPSTFQVPTTSSLVNWVTGQGHTMSSGSFRIVDSQKLRIKLDGVGAGTAHVIVDYTGWYSRATGNVAVGNGRTFVSANDPRRVYDSRTAGAGGTELRLGAGQTRSIQVEGVNGVPADVFAVALNVTAIGPTTNTFLSAFSSALSTAPGTSVVNVQAGDSPRAGQIAIQAGSDGRAKIFNDAGSVNFIVDVVGWWIDNDTSANAGRALFSGAYNRPPVTVDPGVTVKVATSPISNPTGPKYGIRAAMVNVKAFNATGTGWLVFHRNSTVPSSAGSNLNFTTAENTTNSSFAPTDTIGEFYISNPSGSAVTVSIDVTGWILR